MSTFHLHAIECFGGIQSGTKETIYLITIWNSPTAQITNAEIDWAKIKNVEITSAQIANADIQWANIKNVQVETAQIKTAAVDTLQIKGDFFESLEQINIILAEPNINKRFHIIKSTILNNPT